VDQDLTAADLSAGVRVLREGQAGVVQNKGVMVQLSQLEVFFYIGECKEACPMLEALKLKGIVKPGRQLELPKLPPELPEGEVEVILLYQRGRSEEGTAPSSPMAWPTLDGGRYLGGKLRREELYDDDGR
jgi:hypothetical protein